MLTTRTSCRWQMQIGYIYVIYQKIQDFEQSACKHSDFKISVLGK